jgi:nitrogen fixation/metabolism regulation signal transduction histidine kinase
MTRKILEKGDFIESVLQAIPLPIFVVDEDVRIFWSNQSASPLLEMEPDLVFLQRCGDVLHCQHAVESTAGCGRTEFCKDCPIRNSVRESMKGQQVVRKRNRLIMVGKDKVVEINLLVSTAPFIYQGESLVLLILEDISELMELKGIVPICAYCKKIRNDKAYWQSVEHYFKVHMNLNFTHGVCPECAKKVFPDLKA